MITRLTADAFDSSALAAVTTDLRGRGLDVEETWMHKSEPGTRESADGWQLVLEGEPLVSQSGHRVSIDAVAGARDRVLRALISHGILKPPVYDKAIVWLVIFVVLTLWVVSQTHVFGAFAGFFYTICALFVAGHAMAYASLRAGNPDWPVTLAYILMAPLLVVTFPASLLNIPMIRQYIRGRHYLRGKRGDPGDATVVEGA